MGELKSIEFGPFRRSVTSVEPHRLPLDAASGGINYLVDPVAGGMFKRSGSIVSGDTLSASKRAVAGILESSPGYTPCRLRKFYSDALTDGALGGSSTYSVLYRKEASSASWPTIDNGIFGTEYVRRPNANYTLLSEFGSGCYPTSGSSFGGSFEYRVVPFWYESGEGGYSRGAFEFTRRFACSGSWNSLDAGRWRYYPNLRGTPMRWDGGCNDSSASIANVIRFYPTGPLPPPWLPVATDTGSGVAATSRPWKDGDTFFYSVMYQFEDGSYSAPVIPRGVNALHTAGYGLKVVGTPGGANHYTSITYTNIPLGPPGTIARILLRSPKENRTAATDLITVSVAPDVDGVGGLQVFGILDNNTQTSYVDKNGDDSALVQNANVVRFDLMMPPRAREIGTGDNRAIVGYTLPHPGAIMLTCAGLNNDWDIAGYGEDSASLSSTTAACYRVTSTALELVLTNGGAIVATSTITADWATYTTIQDVVDYINTSTAGTGGAGSATGQWRAEIVPGADPTAPSSSLCPTVIAVANCTASGATLTTSNSFSAVPIGYKCYAAAGMTAGTYILRRTNATTMVLDQSSTTAAATVTFYADCGDEACVTTAGSKGWIRVFGSPIYGMVYFKRSALGNYDRPAKDRIYFTTASPGAASTGVSLAPNSWVRSNRRDGVNSPGPIMGIVDVQGAAVIVCRDRTELFVNERGNNTGEDFDMRRQTINQARGCCSPWSVIGVNGCCVYASSIGIEATDKSKRTIKISGDVYEAVRGRGDFGYEIPLCVSTVDADSPECWMVGAAWGHRIVYAYRPSAETYAFIVYDFSPGVDSLGIDSLANPDTRTTYGWSTACYLDTENYQFAPLAMGAVPGGGGLQFYGALNDNNGTNDGRVDQMFTGTTDNGVNVYGAFNTAVVRAPSGARFSGANATFTHRVPYAGVTAQYLRVATADTSLALSTAGSNDYLREHKQLTQRLRSPGDRAAWLIQDDTANVGGLVWTAETIVEVLPKVGG